MTAWLGTAAAFSVIYRICSYKTALALYLIHTILSGISCGTIFLYFEFNSIMEIFAITAAGFMGLCAYGYLAENTLEEFGTLFFYLLFHICNVYLRYEAE